MFGEDIVASVRRLGLITFRIAMILTTLRIMDGMDIAPDAGQGRRRVRAGRPAERIRIVAGFLAFLLHLLDIKLVRVALTLQHGDAEHQQCHNRRQQQQDNNVSDSVPVHL